MLNKEDLKTINAFSNKNAPGVIRGPGDTVSATADYIEGALVDEQLNEFFEWFYDALKKCDADPPQADPIHIAASSYQRLVSIHPFRDANGRTCRAVMDYVLQRYGLPPAALEVSSVAVFGKIEAGYDSGDVALQLVITGIKNSYELLA